MLPFAFRRLNFDELLRFVTRTELGSRNQRTAIAHGTCAVCAVECGVRALVIRQTRPETARAARAVRAAPRRYADPLPQSAHVSYRHNRVARLGVQRPSYRVASLAEPPQNMLCTLQPELRYVSQSQPVLWGSNRSRSHARHTHRARRRARRRRSGRCRCRSANLSCARCA